MHSGTERLVHFEETWSSVCCAFNFRYATELIIVTDHFVPTSTRHDQKSLTIEVLMRRNAKRRQSIPVRKCVILIERCA
jgi:hypothetical protein